MSTQYDMYNVYDIIHLTVSGVKMSAFTLLYTEYMLQVVFIMVCTVHTHTHTQNSCGILTYGNKINETQMNNNK